MEKNPVSVLVLGGGAAGFFAAIHVAENLPDCDVTLLESGTQVLGKVKISGGGRCNVTHACFEPKQLVKFYPRGEKALLGPFHTFHCGNTLEWFEGRGVKLKTEADGRIFPQSDDSQTIIDCLLGAARKAGVKIRTKSPVENIIAPAGKGSDWKVQVSGGPMFSANYLVVATGSSYRIWDVCARLGHTIAKPVPSLFTFNVNDPRIQGLEGLSIQDAACSVADTKLETRGPLLVTHWGFSGPAILKLSAWGARDFFRMKYAFTLKINFTGKGQFTACTEELMRMRSLHPRKNISGFPLFNIPARLWERLVTAAGIPPKLWADLSNEEAKALASQLCEAAFTIHSKSTNKDEFVTCGGIDRDEVDFRTMESKKLPGVFFAGEVLDVDALTGGFNFQAAWTTAWIAAESIIKKSIG